MGPQTLGWPSQRERERVGLTVAQRDTRYAVLLYTDYFSPRTLQPFIYSSLFPIGQWAKMTVLIGHISACIESQYPFLKIVRRYYTKLSYSTVKHQWNIRFFFTFYEISFRIQLNLFTVVSLKHFSQKSMMFLIILLAFLRNLIMDYVGEITLQDWGV